MEQPDKAYENSRRIWVTASWVIVGTIVGQVGTVLVLLAFGVDLETMMSGDVVPPAQALIVMVMVVQVLSYLLPGIVSAYTLFKQHWPRAVQLLPSPSLKQLLLGVVAFALCVPLTAALAQVNASIELAGWQADIEANVAETLATIIKGNSIAGLLAALAILGVLPAVGEELVFRGLIQPGIIRSTGSAHLGVWLTAIAFGLVHFQFAGILPRIFLGAVLGFLAYYSQRLWVPIVAHFLFNGSQVVALRYGAIEDSMPEHAPLEYDSLGLMAIGLVGAGLASYLLPKLAPPNPIILSEDESEANDQP